MDAKAVSKLLIPFAASSNVQFLSVFVWGAWSVAMTSIVSFNKPLTRESTSFCDLRGGATLILVSYGLLETIFLGSVFFDLLNINSSVNVKWWGVA